MNKAKYKHPVLIEAVLELRFPSNDKWGMSSFIKFANLARKEGCTEVVDAPDGFQVNFSFGEGKQPELQPVSRRIQTWNKEKTRLWQASPELFAANIRSPYPGWEKFKPHILKGFEIYSKIAQPKKAVTLSINYVNKIEFDNNNPPLDYLIFFPPKVDYADSIDNFGCLTQQTFKNGDAITVSTARDLTPDTMAIMLNILYTAKSPSLETNSLKQTIERAHTRVIDAFEKSITVKQRERMEVI